MLSPGAVLLPSFALPQDAALLRAIARIAASAPFRHMRSRFGIMSAAMTNCGRAGWVADRGTYGYTALDPQGGSPWPAMPRAFATLAATAAAAAGYSNFRPDGCLINRYAAATRMGLHQDKDEPDLTQPIVSVSLGLPATFLWNPAGRTGTPTRLTLAHGDVLVWGGPSRLAWHGIAPLAPGVHSLTGMLRYNLTFRCTRPPSSRPR